ncbi:MAG TPA: caspase family protein, partial [Vicinamibacteria bacterium]|nr:caspase family protein [Vicinamibacteria bacterium]
MTARLAAAAAAACLAATCAHAQPSPSPSAGPRKRALIVALSTYAPSSGWASLSSAADVGLVRGALEAHGFTDIATLADAQATRAGILRAIKDTLLDPARPGDVLVFHYSGHGQQITDDAAEEADGYDEALVPFDAPMAPGPGYRGDKHLRDDTMAEQLDALRRRAGAGGNVVVWLDSCNSGSGTRG